jgi:hypothetical protein
MLAWDDKSGCFFPRLRSSSLRSPPSPHGFGKLPAPRGAQSCLLGCRFFRLGTGAFRGPTFLHGKRQPPAAFRGHATFPRSSRFTGGFRRRDASGVRNILQSLECPVDSCFLRFELSDDVRNLIHSRFSPRRCAVKNLKKA